MMQLCCIFIKYNNYGVLIKAMKGKIYFYPSRSYEIAIYDRNFIEPCREQMINGHQAVEVMNYLNGKISNQKMLPSRGSHDVVIYDCMGYFRCQKERVGDYLLEQVLNYLANSSGSDKIKPAPSNNVQTQLMRNFK